MLVYYLLPRYLPEYTPLGTAGGLFHFRDQILASNPEAIFVFNSDVCCNFELKELLLFHRSKAVGDVMDWITIVATEVELNTGFCHFACVRQLTIASLL